MNIPYDFEKDIESIINELRSNGWKFDGCGSDNMPYSLSWCKSLSKGFKDKDDYNIFKKYILYI